MYTRSFRGLRRSTLLEAEAELEWNTRQQTTYTHEVRACAVLGLLRTLSWGYASLLVLIGSEGWFRSSAPPDSGPARQSRAENLPGWSRTTLSSKMPRRGQPLGNDDGPPIDPQVQDDARMEDGQPIHPLNHDGDNDSQDSSSEDEDNNKVEIASLLATSRKNVRKELAKMRLPAQLKQGSTADKQQQLF